MDNWGCEFAEENCYRQEPLPPPRSNIIHLEMSMLREVVDRRYLKEISSRDRFMVQALTADVARRGILEPGILVYDTKRVRLQDGNHRFLAAEALGLFTFPVVITRVSNIQAPGAPLEFAFEYLIQR